MPRQIKGSVHARRAIAAQAARLIAADGLADYGAAKHKAARQLGFRETDGLPDNGEIEEALRTYQALFQNEEQRTRLMEMRRAAQAVMRDLATYRPYLAGATWNGTATRGAPIDIDLFTDDEKLLELSLINRGVAFTAAQRPHFLADLQARVPVLKIEVEGFEVRLSVFRHSDQRYALRPGAKGSVERGDAHAVADLLASDDERDRVERFLATIR